MKVNSHQQLTTSNQDQGSFHRIAIVGLGLIGGSLLRNLRRTKPDCALIGVDFPEVIARTGDLLDQTFPPNELAQALCNADLVFLATPISMILRLLPEVANVIPPGAVVTDMGSTKSLIVAQAQKYFTGERYFIGGHPMAGSEKSGWDNADPYLFQNSIYVLTPLPNFPKTHLQALTELLQTLGAQVMTLDPEIHDRLAAEVSHLPQLLAVALANFIAREEEDVEARVKLAAGGFRDMTRIAASPFSVWRDILSSNRSNIRQGLRQFISALQQLAQDFDNEKIEPEFQHANQIRQRILRNTSRV
jgi:prephenate dehydrogenase